MKFNYIKYTYLWFAISIIAILVGIVAMVSNQFSIGKPLELGIDFTGGSLLEITLETGEVDKAELRSSFEEAFPKSVNQITYTSKESYVIHSKEMSEETLQNVLASVQQDFGPYELLRFTSIGPKVGETLKQKAIIALSIALVAIVLYIAYAFRKVPKKVSPWRFGFSAIVALAHDVLITLGIFALLGYEINAFFITALLTIMGFSVHDTIVVFDRIRENLKKQTRDDTFGDVANVSLNQTLSRSINTSVSTLFPLLALYIWGAESIRVFVFALIVGIIVGTYSSIFVASPVLTIWQEQKRLR
jgi:preprotein translocase subunit SecF